ncbi:putative invertase inhibitor [Amaranthus tricolor]|uniref:putative invertase inhibitor n=1 Tax=Amaranthus tricolor TaxID=29722 RepID=UPI00258DD957|nr:putative invertase inhibitor [Amaranthus tricolor]
MNSSYVLQYSLVFIFSLLVPHRCAAPIEKLSADTISKTCEQCAQKASSSLTYDFCYTSLDAVPLSHVADPAGLGLIALELALENTTTTASTISSILNKNESNPGYSCLKQCFELYLDISVKLEESIKDFVYGKNYDVVYLWVSEIMQQTHVCEAGFKEKGVESPLTKENHNLSQLCSIVLCIMDLIRSDLRSWF